MDRIIPFRVRTSAQRSPFSTLSAKW